MGDVDVHAADDGVWVRGLSEREVLEALAVRDEISAMASRLDAPVEVVRRALYRRVSAEVGHVHAMPVRRRQLLDVLMLDPSTIDPVPHATLEQVRRVAATRNRLLAVGAYTIASLAHARGAEENAVRTWLSRHRRAHRLFTVKVRGETFLPVFLLDEGLEPFADLAGVIRPLERAGMDGWALWVWFDAPSSWLGGDRPVDVIAEGRFDRLARAAGDKASNAAA